MNRPRVLLAEDHWETAEHLRRLLQVEFEVIAWVEAWRPGGGRSRSRRAGFVLKDMAGDDLVAAVPAALDTVAAPSVTHLVRWRTTPRGIRSAVAGDAWQSGLPTVFRRD